MKLSLAAYSMTSFVKEADIEGKLNHVSEGAKLCENSETRFDHRRFFSISRYKRELHWLHPSEAELRKQFCPLQAYASFHTAWVVSGPR